jgi:hypothetical protein
MMLRHDRPAWAANAYLTMRERTDMAKQNDEPQTVVKHAIELTKQSKRRLNESKINQQLKSIIDRGMGGGRMQRGWSIEIANKADLYTPRLVPNTGEYRYICKLSLVNTPKRKREESAIKQEFDSIIKFISTAGNVPGWEILTIDNKMVDTSKDERIQKPVGYVAVEIPSDWREQFSHIYERDDQIDILMSAIRAGVDSNFQDRFHCALVGPPACGKTETLRTVKKILGNGRKLGTTKAWPCNMLLIVLTRIQFYYGQILLNNQISGPWLEFTTRTTAKTYQKIYIQIYG